MSNFSEKELMLLRQVRELNLGNRQDSILSQLNDLMVLGNAFRLYDAVDYIYNTALKSKKEDGG